MRPRYVEAGFIALMAVAVLVGGRSLLVQVASFRGVAISVLGVIAIVIVYAFRREFLAGGPLARIHAARDTAFLAAIAAAVAFVAVPQRWSLGATTVALEIALIVELMSCLVDPVRPSK